MLVNMLVKRGTLIDATTIEAQARRPQSEAGARSGTDPDAAWTRNYLIAAMRGLCKGL